LGITHAEVGYILGEHWLLPNALTTAIRYHHEPELQPGPGDTSAVVFLANSFCETAVSGIESEDSFDERTLEVLDRLKMSSIVFRKALDSYTLMENSADVSPF
jgi:HD-like signal output (HDOD) protein